jgi:hypothetical protein
MSRFSGWVFSIVESDMNQAGKLRKVVGVSLMLAFAGCASTGPIPYAGINSSADLRQNPHDTNGRVPYRYDSKVDWRQYTSMMIEPVEIYHGKDAQFEEVSEEEKSALALYMQKTFSERLASRLRQVQSPQAHTLRVKLTLTGAEKSAQGLSTVFHFDLAGGTYNIVQAVRGGQPAMTGSVSYAVEVYDVSTGRLLKAYVTKQYPRAMNVAASFGALHAARTGIERGAASLLEEIE